MSQHLKLNQHNQLFKILYIKRGARKGSSFGFLFNAATITNNGIFITFLCRYACGYNHLCYIVIDTEVPNPPYRQALRTASS